MDELMISSCALELFELMRDEEKNNGMQFRDSLPQMDMSIPSLSFDISSFDI